VDREKFERADKEAKRLVEAERMARDAKSARLKELRLALQPQKPAETKLARQRKSTRRVIEVG
jgi:hypothetical protein